VSVALPYLSDTQIATFLLRIIILSITIIQHKCMFWFSLLLSSATFLILRIPRHIIVNAHMSLCKVPVKLVRFFKKNLNFPDRFSKNPQILNFMTRRPATTELFYAAGQTEWQNWVIFAILRTRLKKQQFETVTRVFNFISLLVWISIIVQKYGENHSKTPECTIKKFY